jgi:twitching motility protein PilT
MTPMQIAELLKVAVQRKASDLHLTVKRPPMIRVYGELLPIPDQPEISAEIMEELLLPLLNQKQQQILRDSGQVDFSYFILELGRFRVNVFRQRGSLSAVMRLISNDIPSLESLGMPEIVRSFTEKARGLVLVTGPTGSGKSTTLASLIDIINTNRNCHIITLEDPIEYMHHHKKCIVNQREVGSDTDSFANGLRAALREDPDVILIGEMRDLETIQIALTAAETGHLVFATLHTNDATQTLDRIIDVFPPHQQAQVRVQLSMALQGIVAQTLIPKVNQAGRAVAVEIMVTNGAIRNLIREGKTHQLPTVMLTGSRIGMQTMDSSLKALYQRGIISIQEALLRASDQDEFKKSLGVM